MTSATIAAPSKPQQSVPANNGSAPAHNGEHPKLFQRVREQMDRAAEAAGLAPEVRKILSSPACEVAVNFP